MIPSATARAPWSLRRWLRGILAPPTPLRPAFTTRQWHRPFVEVATAIVEAAVRLAEPPRPTLTVGDVHAVMCKAIMASDPRWDRVQIDRSELNASTDIAARCRRCRAWSVASMHDIAMLAAESRPAVFMDAVDRLGCYCVARPSEATP